MGGGREVTVQRLARGRRRWRFEGVWVQRAAERVTMGEAVGVVVMAEGVVSKGSRLVLYDRASLRERLR